MQVTVNAPAKINLTLDILGRRADGYHTVRMLMQSVSLSDTVTLTAVPEGSVQLWCSRPDLPCDEGNIAYRAAQLFFAQEEVKPFSVKIDIQKRIPVAAGLAGGSTDAAAVLVGLNHMAGMPFHVQQLAQLGAALGADVPFCLLGGTMIAQGIGTELTAAPPLPACSLVLAKPGVSVSTQEAYRQSDKEGFCSAFGTGAVLAALQQGDLSSVAAAVCNDFEQVLQLESIQKIKAEMLRAGALGACMSGSGPTVFGVFALEEQAQACAMQLQKELQEVFVCTAQQEGCRVIKTV